MRITAVSKLLKPYQQRGFTMLKDVHGNLHDSLSTNSIPSKTGPPQQVFAEFSGRHGDFRIQLSGDVFTHFCEKLGSSYKVAQWLGARLTEVDTLSVEAVRGYLNVMVRNQFPDVAKDLLGIQVLPMRIVSGDSATTHQRPTDAQGD
ncbi:hypothetical protein ACJU26_05640 [Acidithiobacillus sp. M4-SHS-6]|uniref:hypothetical protein n=1 Tax=Acidithiobacillus sp. M4-SHS-6 TaxID=3383024 RepID=UPI0039BE573A